MQRYTLLLAPFFARSLLNARVEGGGGGERGLPYITYTGMCRPTGSWFWSSWFTTGYPFQRRFLERGITSRTRESSSFVRSRLKLFKDRLLLKYGLVAPCVLACRAGVFLCESRALTPPSWFKWHFVEFYIWRSRLLNMVRSKSWLGEKQSILTRSTMNFQILLLTWICSKLWSFKP